ncbi:MAG: PKD domain-containing protein [Bacteroidota bacterium]
MKILRVLLLLLFIIFGNFQAESKHIIGGEITYVCNGSGEYDFTMRIYRDCAGGGACFDSDFTCPFDFIIATVTIFAGETAIGRIELDQPVITEIDPVLSNPCLIAPPNVCVEEGIYRFSAILPSSSAPITISYQRCCRNNFILNIVRPDIAGSTYTNTIPAIARDSCNSSPVFNDFPPIVICRGEDVNFDHSASDVDGDSLVYGFCSPYYGGGYVPGGPNPPASAPNGLAPDPETPPPYENVRFAQGFSIERPLNKIDNRDFPSVTINPETGLISGFPGNTGQYVVGVCVRAYKDGILMNEVRRDFQFNVADCDNNLKVDVEETELREKDGQPLFYIRICGDDQIVNESTNFSYIEDVYWEFDIPGGKTTSTRFNPDDLNFPGEGPYDGKLVLNPDFPQCTATGLVQVEIYPEIVADYEFDFDTCQAGPVEFTNLSYSEAGPDALVELRWRIDTVEIFQKDLSYQFPEAGRYDVTLTARDINECVENITKEIPFLPLPPILAIGPLPEQSCVPTTITFENLSNPINSEYDIVWDLGDGNSTTGLSPTHTYDQVGTFPISLNVTSPFGCTIDTSFGNIITTVASPVADFTMGSSEISRLDPVAEFFNQSTGAIRHDWLFDDFGRSREVNPTYVFAGSSGEKIVRLIVTGENGCRDTTYSSLIITPDIRYQLPNAFTPNGDGVNDEFFGVGNADEAVSFYLSIWNRYGELIFETNDADQAWNGRKNNVGEEAPNGVYVVTVTYENFNGEITNLKGMVTVIR